jgi:hypothetical protein
MAVTGAKSLYLQEALIAHVLKSVTYSDPAAVYCGLASDSATDEELEAGTLTNEIAGYTGNRPAITFGAITEATNKATVKNSAAIDFLLMPAPAGRKIHYVFISDAATAGHILYWGHLTAEKDWNLGDTFTLPIDALVVDEA